MRLKIKRGSIPKPPILTFGKLAVGELFSRYIADGAAWPARLFVKTSAIEASQVDKALVVPKTLRYSSRVRVVRVPNEVLFSDLADGEYFTIINNTTTPQGASVVWQKLGVTKARLTDSSFGQVDGRNIVIDSVSPSISVRRKWGD